MPARRLNKMKNAGLILLSALAFSCNRIDTSSQSDNSVKFEDLSVSQDFDWTTSSISNISELNDPQFEGKTIAIRNENAEILAVVPSAHGANFQNWFVPNNAQLYFSGNGVEDQASGKVSKNPRRSLLKSSSDFCGQDHASFDRVLGNNENDVTISGETVLINGPITGTLTVYDDAEVYICADLTLNDLVIRGAGKSDVYVSANSTINIDAKLSQHYAGDHFYNLGTIHCKGLEVGAGTFENFGSLTTTSETYLNRNGVVFNDGVWNTPALKISGQYTNNGSINATSFTVWPGATATNNCSINCSSTVSIQGTLYHNGYLGTSYNFYSYAGSTVYGTSNSHIYCRTIDWTGAIENVGNKPFLIEVSHYTKIKNGATKSGLIDVCDKSGVDLDEVGLYPLVMKCESFIQQGECNPRGFVSEFADSDNDGTPDNLDPMPNDNSINAKSEYPIDGKSFYCFEDLWPYQGDFDFNDYVFSIHSNNYYNDATLVRMDVTVVIEAIGGSLPFDLAFRPTAVAVDGGKNIYTAATNWFGASSLGNYSAEGEYLTLVNDVPRAVVPFYSNTGTGPSRAPDTLRFSINVNNMEAGKTYVPELFMVSNTDPAIEIHMANRPPSNLASADHFGTGNDSSGQNGSYYKSENGLPWGVEILTSSSFRWPKDKISITDAYPTFSSWAQSEGNAENNWFTSPKEANVY